MSSNSLSELATGEIVEEHRALDRIISKLNRIHTSLLPPVQEQQKVNKVRRLRLRDELARRASHGDAVAQLYLGSEASEGYQDAA